ncbi:growth-regulated alpha protein-like isoform X2 [Anabas testudineus]|nr:growth-regulated alpha protein-like isoform X2 [Anabas testudineus]
MNSLVTVVLACLLVFCAQGQPANRSSRCKCVTFIGNFKPKLIKTEPVIYEPSVFCPNTEIIVTIANKEKCVDPQSPLGKLILKNKHRQMKKRAKTTTTASAQTDTWRSTA